MDIETQLPSTLDERQKNVVQMQTIRRLTVEPGVMMLPCVQVSGGEESEKWTVDVEHPVIGEIRFHRKKPKLGWDEDQELVKLLNWYDINDDNVYKLQEKFLYVRHNEESDNVHDWELINPDYREQGPSQREKAREWYEGKRPKRNALIAGVIYTLITGGVTVGMLATESMEYAGKTAATFALGIVMAVFLLAMLIPPEDA